MRVFNHFFLVIFIMGCSPNQSNVECNKVDTQMATVFIDCIPEFSTSDCINSNIYNLIRTEDYKRNTLIKFNDSKDDAEIKVFLKTLYPQEEKENSNFMTLHALDIAFNRDRELGNKYIYKILNLMDRNYDINSLTEDALIKVTAKARRICENN